MSLPLVYLKPGEMHVCRQTCRIETVLGSCVSVVLHCPVTHVSAMNHAVMPIGSNSLHYVDYSLEQMIKQFRALGGRRQGMQAKLFGGANMFDQGQRSSIQVGQKNVEVALGWLAEQKIGLITSNTGGTEGRKLVFLSETGQVFVKKLDRVNPAERFLPGAHAPVRKVCPQRI
ncbi:MAG: chemotaxis protein CheD [Desulfuromonadaceae bacterium]|nr:chemotaxis protein CheD [Desulfuromonadaceae bacterium]